MSRQKISCPCCGGFEVLRHARQRQVYLFCMNCRQELPLIIANIQPLGIREKMPV
jgi:hypothetical protein